MEPLMSILEELNEIWKLSGETLEKLAVYANLLAEKNKVMNLTAVDDPRGICVRHFADSLCLEALRLLPQGAKIVDVGTGAGFPGLVIAIARPDLTVCLLDSQKKRIGFLEETASAAGIVNVETLWGRAEDLGRDARYRESFDAAVARAVAPMPVLSEYLAPFVRPEGIIIAWKGEAVLNEWDASRRALHLLGAADPKDHPYTLPGEDMKLHLVTVEKLRATPKAYPRKAGMPSRQPLGVTEKTKKNQ